MYFECRHIMHNGARCHSPALRGKDYCYYHSHLHKRAKSSSARAADDPLSLPFLEDRSAIQVAVSQILDALGSAKLDPQRAGLLLYGLQIASQNVERNQDILPFKAVESISHSSEGDELAPELRICESSDDCSTCNQRITCPDVEPEEDSPES